MRNLLITLVFSLFASALVSCGETKDPSKTEAPKKEAPKKETPKKEATPAPILTYFTIPG